MKMYQKMFQRFYSKVIHYTNKGFNKLYGTIKLNFIVLNRISPALGNGKGEVMQAP